MKSRHLLTFLDNRDRIEELYTFYIRHILFLVTIFREIVRMHVVDFIFQEFNRSVWPPQPPLMLRPIRGMHILYDI